MMMPLEKLGLSIKRLQDHNHRTLDAHLSSLGVSLVQWDALRAISRHPGSSQLKLAELTFNSAQAFGALVMRMEAAGLVRRIPSGGRAFALTLTPKGEELLEMGKQVVLDVLADSFGGLSKKECATLQDLITKVLHHNEISN